MIVLDNTPFYAESGGQAGDSGQIATDNANFDVTDTQKQGNIFMHIGICEHGSLTVGDVVTSHVDEHSRSSTALNHSATHLLHAALQQILGDHVVQKGLLVNAHRLRFDFSHFEPVNEQQLHQLERLVNQQIRLNHEIETEVMSLEQAKKSGAMALFGEKYDDNVRVLRMSDFSTELCGGIHANRTGDIGLIKIISETGVASGIRRIEAVTAESALDYIEKNEYRLQQISNLVKAKPENIQEKTTQLIQRTRQLEKELDILKGKLASNAGGDLANSAHDIAGIKVLAAQLEGADVKHLRDTVDQLKNKLGTAVIILSAIEGKKITLIAGVTKNTTDKIKAGELVAYVASRVGGKGGGRPDMAQGGGTQPENITTALDSVTNWVSTKLDN